MPLRKASFLISLNTMKVLIGLDAVAEESASNSITLEVAVGLGVSGKGFASASSDAHTLINTLFQEATDLLQQKDLAAAHWNKFYWTSEAARGTSTVQTTAAMAADRVVAEAMEQKYRRSSTVHPKECDYEPLMTISISQSYISFTASTNAGAGYSAECMRLLATVAVMQPSIAHVSAHLGVHLASPADTQQQQSVSSIR